MSAIETDNQVVTNVFNRALDHTPLRLFLSPTRDEDMDGVVSATLARISQVSQQKITVYDMSTLTNEDDQKLASCFDPNGAKIRCFTNVDKWLDQPGNAFNLLRVRPSNSQPDTNMLVFFISQEKLAELQRQVTGLADWSQMYTIDRKIAPSP